MDRLVAKGYGETMPAEIPDEEAEKITTIQSAIDYVNANKDA